MRAALPPILATVAATLILSGCTSMEVHLSPGGQLVRAAYIDSVSNCRQVGTVTVSVTDHVGPFARGNLSVRDNLEVLARNAGAGLQANTVKPLGSPVNGQQSWGAYVCPAGALPQAGGEAGGSPAAPATAAPQAGYAPAQTQPLQTEPLQVQPVSPAASASASTASSPAASDSSSLPPRG